MTRRPILGLLAVLFLAAACGREGSILPSLTTADQRTPSPTATPAAPAQAAEATPTPTGGAAATPTRAPEQQAGPGTQAQPAQPVEEGGIRPPKDGRYVYNYEGRSSDPFNPAAPPQEFEGELVSEISHDGNVYTERQTNDQNPGVFTTRTRWEESRILLLSFRTQTAGGDFGCVFDPPLVLANLPIRPGAIPTQEFRGEGNACDGSLDINVMRREEVQDATGRTWSTWRVAVRIEAGNEQFTTVTDETQWLAPELGVEVRSDGTTHGEIRTPTGSQTFDGEATAALRSHP